MSSLGVGIRSAQPGDVEALARVHVASWRWAYRGIMPDEVLDSLSWQERRDRWREWVGDAEPDMHTWVVTAQQPDDLSTVVGFASWGPSRDDDTGPEVAELYAIYLAEPWSRRGLGTRLLRAGLDELAARFTRLAVWVLQDNVGARAFYMHCGLLPDGAQKTLEIGGRALVEVRCTGRRADVVRRLAG
jgi:GNAT superfamily N-acetyltransferase